MRFDTVADYVGIQVLLITTNWPQRIEDQKRLNCHIRERDLKREFWRDMVRGGSFVEPFDDTHASAKAIVRRFAGKPNITLALQDELAKLPSLKSTNAFRFIVDRRQRDEAVLRVAAMSGEYADADRSRSVAIRKDSEGKLHDDIVERVRLAIQEQEEAERKQRKKTTVKGLLRWLLGIAHIAMGATQVGLAAAQT